MAELDAQAIINYISNVPKKAPVRVYLKGNLGDLEFPAEVETFLEPHTGVISGDWTVIEPLSKKYSSAIESYHVGNDVCNSAVPLLDLKDINARIEPGAIIRNKALIGDNAVIMMGATINIGAETGADSMIDMGVVLGGHAIADRYCHIGAGTVLAGVAEPASAEPIRTGGNVVIGANAVVTEGVHVGEGTVIAAGAMVTHDVAPHTMVAGVPAKFIKNVDDQTAGKTELEDDLRKL